MTFTASFFQMQAASPALSFIQNCPVRSNKTKHNSALKEILSRKTECFDNLRDIFCPFALITFMYNGTRYLI